MKTGIVIFHDYLTGTEYAPLSVRLEACKKQILLFRRMSKTRLTTADKLALLDAWQSVELLKSHILTQMIVLQSNFSLN